METFLGTPMEATALPDLRRVRPVNAALKGRLMSILSRSLAAANANPLTLQVIALLDLINYAMLTYCAVNPFGIWEGVPLSI